MKSVSGGFATNLSNEATYLCRIWRVTLNSGTVLYFTDLTDDLTYGGHTYVYDPGITVSAIAQSAGGAVQNAEMTIAFKDSIIEESDVRKGYFDKAGFVLEIIDYKNVANGTMTVFTGVCGDVTWTDSGSCSIDLRGLLASSADATIGEVYSKNCRAQLGDSRCTVDIDALAVTLTVDAISGLKITASELTQVDNYWALGTIEFTSGANSGKVYDIISSNQTLNQVVIGVPFAETVQVGDTATVRPGCDKNITTCATKFSNELNFRGEPYAPSISLNAMTNFPQPPQPKTPPPIGFAG